MAVFFNTGILNKVTRPIGFNRAETVQPPLPTSQVIMNYLRDYEPFPPYTGFLGVCEDGLPLMVDFYNPSPGSFLIIGETKAITDSLIFPLIESVNYLNYSKDIGITIVSADPYPYYSFAHRAELLDLRVDQPLFLMNPIYRYYQQVEQSVPHVKGQPVSILIIDDLPQLSLKMDQNGIDMLSKIVLDGPAQQVWVVAGLPTDGLYEFDDGLFHSFRTPLIGYLASHTISAYCLGKHAYLSNQLTPGEEYLANLSGELVRFRIPT